MKGLGQGEGGGIIHLILWLSRKSLSEIDIINLN